MGKTRALFKKIRDTKGRFHTKMGSIKDRNGMDLREAEDIKKRWQEYTEFSSVAQSCLTLQPHGLQPTRPLHPWDFPGKGTGVGCHCLLEETSSLSHPVVSLYFFALIAEEGFLISLCYSSEFCIQMFISFLFSFAFSFSSFHSYL